MANEVSIGSTGVQRTTRVLWDRENGARVVVEWRGLPAYIAALTPPGSPVDVDIIDEGAYQRLIATYTCVAVTTAGGGLSIVASTDEIAWTWELDWNRIEKSIFNHPDYGVGASNEPAYGDIAAVKQAVQQVEDGGDAETIVGALDADLQPLAKLLLGGVESYPVSQAVLRKTLVFDPANESIAIAYENVNKLLTLAKLEDDEPTLANEPFTLPTSGYWFKHPPKVGPAPHGKRQMVQEWEWVEDFVIGLHGSPIDAT